MVSGRCHCGNIEIQVANFPEEVTSCNCSICKRYAAIWAFCTVSEVEVVSGEKGLKAYRWGDEYIDFQHCNCCGCVTHYTSTGKEKSDRVGVNIRMFPSDIQDKLSIKFFDGADTWKYVDKNA